MVRLKSPLLNLKAEKKISNPAWNAEKRKHIAAICVFFGYKYCTFLYKAPSISCYFDDDDDLVFYVLFNIILLISRRW